jgi:hypothetical protein
MWILYFNFSEIISDWFWILFSSVAWGKLVNFFSFSRALLEVVWLVFFVVFDLHRELRWRLRSVMCILYLSFLKLFRTDFGLFLFSSVAWGYDWFSSFWPSSVALRAWMASYSCEDLFIKCFVHFRWPFSLAYEACRIGYYCGLF